MFERLKEGFDRVCKKIGLKVDLIKSKVWWWGRGTHCVKSCHWEGGRFSMLYVTLSLLMYNCVK